MTTQYLNAIFKRLNEYFLFKNKRQLKTTELDFRRKIISSKEYAPIFFLSTGRTGTKFFTQLLSKSNQTMVFHSPYNLFCNAQSELIEQGKVAFEMYSKYGFNDLRTNKLLSQLLMASREELLYKTFIHKKTYIETNNRITFLAPAIKYIFPNAKFVHLYRHPGEFIRSGIRRNYYDDSSNSIHELGRLIPLENSIYHKEWLNFDNIQKIAWMWNETNKFIDDFLEILHDEDYFAFNFNELNTKKIQELCIFLNIKDIDESKIRKSINRPTNIQRSGSFPKYRFWDDIDKKKVKDICAKQTLKYGYEL